MTLDERLLPQIAVTLDESALRAIKAQIGTADIWQWCKQANFRTEVLAFAAIGDVVPIPGLPPMFRLRVTAKSTQIPATGEPHLQVVLAAV